MEALWSAVLNSTASRQALLRADRNRPVMPLKEVDPKVIARAVASRLIRDGVREPSLADVCNTIGRTLRRSLGLETYSTVNVHTGWFALCPWLDQEVIGTILRRPARSGLKQSPHKAWHLTLKKPELLLHLMGSSDQVGGLDGMPLLKPAADWHGPTNPLGLCCIKQNGSNPTVTIEALQRLGPDWIGYKVLNKLQRQPWRVNQDVLSAYLSWLELRPPRTFVVGTQAGVIVQLAMRGSAVIGEDSPTPHELALESPFKYSKERDMRKRSSMEREAWMAACMAQKLVGRDFYHAYQFDFRGRIYSTSVYLSEQGTDNGKGLLLFGTKVPLGEHGYRHLLIHSSNTWGEDKCTLNEAVVYAEEHMDEWVSYANDPILNDRWTSADSPFQFLACCFELRRLRQWKQDGGKTEDFPSDLPLYIDGSNNGVQHLAAMSCDEVVGPLVNLTPQETPGDVYRFVAVAVWQALAGMAEASPMAGAQFEHIFGESQRLQAACIEAGTLPEKQAAYAAIKEWRESTRAIREALFPHYWLRVDNPKEQRKVVKRNVMTLGYGGTPYGFGEQIITDTKDISEYLRNKEVLWGIQMGRLVHNVCYEVLPGPAAMLRMFQELGDMAHRKKEDFCWDVPITRFPVRPSYRRVGIAPVRLSHNHAKYSLELQAWTDEVDTEAQRTGVAPNVTHSFDGAHLMLTVFSSPYQVSVVHDSYGCHAGNMWHMWKNCRVQFAAFYLKDPLMQLLRQHNAGHLLPKRGTLDVRGIIKSDYAFR